MEISFFGRKLAVRRFFFNPPSTDHYYGEIMMQLKNKVEQVRTKIAYTMRRVTNCITLYENDLTKPIRKLQNERSEKEKVIFGVLIVWDYSNICYY